MKRKSIIGVLAFLLVLFPVLGFNTTAQAKKAKVKTTKVTLIKSDKGKDNGWTNECFFFRYKIKKIKVKYSKKGIATAKLKKDKQMGQYIQITKKKKGKTTITIKVYKTKKKYKTYKYKVTVTTHLDIANSASAKAKAKKAFALQNKYRKQAGAEPLEWSDELYEVGLYRLKTHGFDAHRNMDGDYHDYFGDFYLKLDITDISENLASGYGNAEKAVKDGWRESPGHYENMISENWQSGAIVKYNHTSIAMFSSLSAKEINNWRNYKTTSAKVVVKRQDKATGKFLTGSGFVIYDMADREQSSWAYHIPAKGQCTILKGLVPGHTYKIYETIAPAGCEKAKSVTFTAKAMSEGVNYITLTN